MRKASVFVDGLFAGILEELEPRKHYRFTYDVAYTGFPVSLEMPTCKLSYEYECFPPFFEGLLPEGLMLEGLLRGRKIDRNDLMSQLIAVGGDMVGAVTVRGIA